MVTRLFCALHPDYVTSPKLSIKDRQNKQFLIHNLYLEEDLPASNESHTSATFFESTATKN